MAESRRGKTVNLTFTTQKIDKAISGLNGECFTPKEISQISGLNKRTINVIMVEKTAKGLLQRVSRGCYKKVLRGSLAQHLPSAFVSTKAWEVLSQQEKPLTNREISEIIEKETKLNLYFSTGKLLSIWYRKKAIDKIGSKRPYGYQIRPDYKGKDRPVTALDFNLKN